MATIERKLKEDLGRLTPDFRGVCVNKVIVESYTFKPSNIIWDIREFESWVIDHFCKTKIENTYSYPIFRLCSTPNEDQTIISYAGIRDQLISYLNIESDLLIITLILCPLNKDKES